MRILVKSREILILKLFSIRNYIVLDLKSSKEKRKNNSKKLVRRNIPNTTLSFENSQGILPAISSVGVLLKSIDNANSTLDFVFVLTVRESELYPPLFLPEDVTCIQEQLNSYRSEVSANGIIYII